MTPHPAASAIDPATGPPRGAARRRGRAGSLPAGGVALALFGVLLVAGIWAARVDRVRTERTEALESETRKNANLALAVDLQTSQLFKGIDQVLLMMKDQQEHPGPRVPLSRLAASAFGGSTSVTMVAVIDERGDVLETHAAYGAINASDREMFKVHQRADSGALLVSPPVLGRMSGRWVITLSRRVNKPDGSFGGLVVISVEPRYLTALFESTVLGEQDVMSLVLESGITLARRRGPAIEFGTDVSQSQLMAEYAKRPIGDYIGPGGVDGIVRVFSYRKMADYPVLATVGTSEADALAPASQRADTYYLVATLASLAIGLVCAVGVVLLARQQRASRRLLEQASLLDEAQDAIVVSDLDRRVTYWNRSAERLYGWSAAEAIGRSVSDLLYPPADREAVQAAYQQLERTGGWLGELHPASRDGRRLITQSRWTLVRDTAGEPMSILTIDTDVTERRQIEQQFYRAQRLESIGTLAGGIAHDLNNVLTPIMIATDVLREQARDDDTRELLATIGDSARRGAEMVGQVLSFARGREGRRSEVSVARLVDDVVRIARDTLPKNIEIVTRVAPSLPPLAGDATQFHQVLLNLCVNARDAMPQGGRLTISAEAMTLPALSEPLLGDAVAGPHVVLQVEDTGAGIPKDVVERIFDPFFTTKAPGKGTGLGLSTSLTIVRNHGGHIRVYSEPGHGTRFRIYLPADQSVDAAAAARAEVAWPKGHGETILLVDDEAAIRGVARHTLEAHGYRVLLAGDGVAGLATYAERQAEIAVVITDMMMPVLGGEALIHALLRLNPKVRIIAASGISSNERVAREASPQVMAFLSKPFTAAALLGAVHEVLSPLRR